MFRISRIPPFVAVLLAAVVVLTVLMATTGCTTNPFKTAQTIEQKGDALYGSYVIATEQGAELLKDATLSDAVKRPIAQAIVDSKAPADSLQDALIKYANAKALIDAGQTPEEKLQIIEVDIGMWIAEATPLINKLIAAVGAIHK